MNISLENYGIQVKKVIRNAVPAKLYEEILLREPEARIASSGAMMVFSHEKTGRSPKDKRIVREAESEKDVWWGDVNMPLDEEVFAINRERTIDYLNTCSQLYVTDAFAGWDQKHRIKIRIIVSRPYHALFMHNMLIRPTQAELEDFREPDYVVFNAGVFPANRSTAQMTSKTSVNLSFKQKEMLILGTEYAGEMKKGVFTIMNYLMPKKSILSMHASANLGKKKDVAIFFGLSGTGKTTLSADPDRYLIGDDEHCWTEEGIFNIEGGCYAKCIDLTEKSEPEIFRAIRYGTILENVCFHPETREVDYHNTSITENTRASYVIDYIPQAKIPCVAGHPQNIIFLTCDAFGILPPVSKLTPAQAMYHFISGYTAKVAGTEVGITEPEATFSACFGAAFMVWHPSKYAELLAKKVKQHNTKVWLVNTGWSGGSYGEGTRISITHTRRIIQAILADELHREDFSYDSIFGLSIPKKIQGLPNDILYPRNSWKIKENYDKTAEKLVNLFKENFKKFEKGSSPEISSAGPK